MPEERGYLFVFREPFHAGTIEECIDAGESFTDVISVRDWQPKPTGLDLISTDGSTMKCAALVQKEHGRVATGKVRIRFADFVGLEAIALADIEQHIGPRFKSLFSRIAAGTEGRVPPMTWQRTLECIACLRPSVMPEINWLCKMAEIRKRGAIQQVSRSIEPRLGPDEVQEAVREGEARYHHLFNELNDAAFVAEVDTGVIGDHRGQPQGRGAAGQAH